MAHRRRMNRDKLVSARKMRRNPTPAEAVLWSRLRSSIDRWRRQALIAGYIADFYSPSLKMVVEVDGGYHATRTEYDAKRTGHLEALGYTVVRATNEEVLNGWMPT